MLGIRCICWLIEHSGECEVCLACEGTFDSLRACSVWLSTQGTSEDRAWLVVSCGVCCVCVVCGVCVCVCVCVRYVCDMCVVGLGVWVICVCGVRVCADVWRMICWGDHEPNMVHAWRDN